MNNKLNHWLIALNCLLMAGSALAGTFTVLNAHDSGPGSLRQAIVDSAPGDTITFGSFFYDTGQQTITTSNELVITNDLTIYMGPDPGVLISSIGASGSGGCYELFGWCRYFSGTRIFNITGGNVSISGVRMLNGSVHGAGGDPNDNGTIFIPGSLSGSGPLAPLRCQYVDGVAGVGGGILNFANLALTNCAINNCAAIGGRGWNCAIICCNEDGNPFGGGGGFGGIGGGGAIWNAGTLVMQNCSFSGNGVYGGDGALGESSYGGTLGDGNGGWGGPAYGGAIWNTGTLVMQNCTVSGNVALAGKPGPGGQTGLGSQGAGLCNAGGSLTMLCCTIYGNSAPPDNYSSGGIHTDQGAFTFGNCIFANNAGVIPDLEDGESEFGFDLSTITDLGFNFVSVDNWGGYTNTDQVGNIVAALDPMLGPLQYHGGPTQIRVPLPGSPVIDRGTNFGITVDQRGFQRPLASRNAHNVPLGGDRSDIGAVEYYPGNPTLNVKAKTPIPGHTPVAEISWVEELTGTPEAVPEFGLEVSHGALVPGIGVYTPVTSPVRAMNGQLVARDPIVPGSDTAFYRANNTMTNVHFIPPPTTLPATHVTNYTATFNGTTIPIGNNTLYWFQYGRDTNYGVNTLTNTLPTSANPVSLPYPIGGLNPLTRYHFQLVVNDDWGTQYGGDTNFITPGLLPVVVTYSIQDGYFGPDFVIAEGTVNGEGTPALAYFEYGTTTGYGAQTPNYYTQIPTDTEIFTNKFFFEGLITNTIYHFRAVGFNGVGKSVGNDYTFYTGGP